MKNLNKIMESNKKTYKWGNYEIELGKVYTYKDFSNQSISPTEKSDNNPEE